jgi:hypothetical protein
VAAPPKDPGFDPLRAAGVVLGALALLALVSLAASAGGPATSGAGRDLVDPLATMLFVFGGIWVAALLVASPIMSGLTLTGGEPKPRRWHGNVLAGVVFLSLVLVGIALLRKLRPGGPDEVGPEGPAGQAPTTPEGTARTPLIDPASIDWLVVGLVFFAALVGFAILAAVLVRPKGRSLPELEARKRLEQVLDETLDDLRAERDPRRAVIAAYARMERALGSYGLPRRPAEAPLEYLGRLLAELTGSASAARRLTRLFERAKFSEHTVDVGMKEDAISAVSDVRDELRALTVA